MIKLLNESKEQVALLTDVTDFKIMKDLNSIEQIEINFAASFEYRDEIKHERYLRPQTGNEYIIKEINDDGYNIQVIAICNIEDLLGNAFKQFTSLEQNLNDTLMAALNGCGWKHKIHFDTTKKRTLRKKITNTYDVLADIKKIFRIEYHFDALNKIVNVYEKMGLDRGSFFMSDLNLVSLNKEGHTYDLITRIYPIGKDDLTIESVNNGVDYVEDLRFKDKVIAAYWKDERYTNANSLKDDAIEKLSELAKPYIAYKATVKDLAAINGNVIHLYDIGDSITLVDKKTKTRDTQRIVKMTIYPNDPDNNTCEIASHALTFEQLQAEKDAILNLAGDTIGTDGTISPDDINGDFKPDLGNNSITGDMILNGAIKAEHISSDSIQTHHLTANSISADKIKANSIMSTHIQADAITADKIAAETILAGSSIIADGAIGSAKISDLSADKLTAGTINTSDITLNGPNGNLRLKGNRLQVFTGIGPNQKERVSLGDVNADGTVYGLRVRGADGETILLDENGVTKEGITDGSITNDKISPGAGIEGGKLNIDSVIETINNDGSKTIAGTRIDIDNKSLSVVIDEINDKSNELDSNIASNTTLINANKDAIKLKVDEQTYNTDKENMTSQINKNTASIGVMKDEINLKVSQTILDNKINTTKEEIQKEINTIQSGIDSEITNLTAGLNDMSIYLETAYRDNIVSEQEKEVLKKQLLMLNSEKDDVIAQTNSLLSTTELIGTNEFTEIERSKASYVDAHNNLITLINNIIGDE